jgi:hypothetical protein
MQFQAWHDEAEIIMAGGMPLLFKNGKAYTPNNSYGGPLNSGFSYVQFTNDLRRLGAREYLIRFSPWLENYRYFPEDKREFSRHTVARDLWAQIKFGHGTRSSICRNQKCGCYCNIINGGSLTNYGHIWDFQELYIQTMERNNSEECYKYPLEYFQKMVKLINKNIDLFAVVGPEGETLAAATFIHDKYTAHYQFSGMNIEYSNLYPMERLISEACNHYKQQGKILIHFGGGIEEDDSLHRFKNKFGNVTLKYWNARGNIEV